AAPLARSTPTLWAYAQRNAHKDTPRNKPLSYKRVHQNPIFDITTYYFLLTGRGSTPIAS
ncbi:MAG: hypothetical protein RML94_13140, partial [Bacteroidia bacterium]|nr:hypothetical protein [Bacteroidia bacterium]